MVELSIITCTARPFECMAPNLAALDAQKFRNFELIVVDAKLDKVEGRPALWEAEKAKRSFPLKVVQDKPIPYKLGLSNARNCGIIWADGRVVLYLDDLMSFDPDFLAGHLRHHRPDEQPRAIAGTCMYKFPGFANDPNPKVIPDGRLTVAGNPTAATKCRPEWLYGMNASVPLEMILKVNGSDERYAGEYGGEDCDLSVRLVRAGCQILLDPTIPVFESRDGNQHTDLFVTEEQGHEDWWNERLQRFCWRNEKFIEELVYHEQKRTLSKNPYSVRKARENRLAGATTWADILRGCEIAPP